MWEKRDDSTNRIQQKVEKGNYLLGGIMARNKEKKDRKKGPVLVIGLMTLVIVLLSFLFSTLEIEGSQTTIANGTLESSLVTVKNVLSVDGFRFMIGNAVSNFKLLEPLVYLIISLIGIGICEKSGFLKVLFGPLRKVKLNLVIYITILMGMISTVMGDYSYIFLTPLIGVMYKYIGKNPVLGILTLYLGITLGYGTGIIFNYNDHLIGMLSQDSAQLTVDPNYKYSLFSNLYIMIISTIVVSLLSTFVIDKFLVPKLAVRHTVEEEELNVSKKAMVASLGFGLCYIVFIIYMILPLKSPLSGILLDHSAQRYMDQLLGTNSPFGNGLVLIITFLFIIFGYIYGKVSGNIKNGSEFSLGLSKNFEGLGFLFVITFFASQMFAILDWSNLGTVVACRLTEFLNGLQFSGIILIVVFFIVVILMSILLPGTMQKWNLLYPTVIPLFMRSNITPGFTQFIFKIADGIGKSITPMFIYFIIMLAFLEKYRTDENHQISVFGTLKLILPCIIMIAGIWLLLIILWYVIGIPIGIGTYITL